MARPVKPQPLNWPALAIVLILALLIIIGRTATGGWWLHGLAVLVGIAGVLLLAGLWQLTLRRSDTAPPLTRRQRAWNTAVFVAWFAIMTGAQGDIAYSL